MFSLGKLQFHSIFPGPIKFIQLQILLVRQCKLCVLEIRAIHRKLVVAEIDVVHRCTGSPGIKGEAFISYIFNYILKL